MIRIAITRPDFFEGEADKIRLLLETGIDLVHVRKPATTAHQIARLLEAVPRKCHHRIVLHDHFELCDSFAVYGVHLNCRNTEPPQQWQGSVSCSCHSLEEVARRKPLMNYVFLSPIFDSISKPGYHSAFSEQRLRVAAKAGIIDEKVMALGGVTSDKEDYLAYLHFGGYAMLGSVW